MNTVNLKTLLRTMIENKTPVTPMLWGRHGIGKSSVVQQLGRELGYRVLTVILSQKEAVDLAGVLYTFEDPKLGMSVTASHPPAWFAQAVKDGNLILFLDEFNMARREVMNAAFELILDRRLNNVTLPDSVFIVCAGNPEDERYDVTPLSESLRDRLMHVQVTPDTDAWLAWAQESQRIHPDVIRFLQRVPDAAHSADDRDSKFPVEIKHSQRSWERVSLIHALPVSAEIKLECYRGIIGPDLALAFLADQREDLPLLGDEVLNLTESTNEKIKRWAGSESPRLDLLSISVSNLISLLNSRKDELPAEAYGEGGIKNVIRFVLSLPGDLFANAVSRLNGVEGWSPYLLKDTRIVLKIEDIQRIRQSA